MCYIFLYERCYINKVWLIDWFDHPLHTGPQGDLPLHRVNLFRESQSHTQKRSCNDVLRIRTISAFILSQTNACKNHHDPLSHYGYITRKCSRVKKKNLTYLQAQRLIIPNENSYIYLDHCCLVHTQDRTQDWREVSVQAVGFLFFPLLHRLCRIHLIWLDLWSVLRWDLFDVIWCYMNNTSPWAVTLSWGGSLRAPMSLGALLPGALSPW